MYCPCTSPIIKIKTYKKFIKKFFSLKNKFDSLNTVSIMDTFMWKNNKSLNYNSFKAPNSQDLPKNYHDTGNFVCIPFTFFKKKKKIEFDKYYVGLKIPKIRSVDIDDLEDWKIAEAFYEKK